MDIILLIKKNIRYKKGSFTSIILLMMIIALSITTIVSIKKNVPESIESAYDRVYDSCISYNISNEYLTEELLDEVSLHPLVKKVKVRKALAPERFKYSDDKKSTFDISIMQMDTGLVRLWKEDFSGYADMVPEPESGEIYVPRAMADNDGVRVGDKVEVGFKDSTYSFVIKGLVEEPSCGSSFMGFKAVFINQKDFNAMYSDREEAAKHDPEAVSDLNNTVYVTKKDECNLSDGKFVSELNKETRLGSFATGITRAESLHYQGLMPEIIMNIFLSFVIILTVIVFVVMSNSISSSIELNYTDLGILKAQGYDSGRLKLVFLGQYMLAEAIGTALGVVLSLPVSRLILNAFEPIIGIKINGRANIPQSLGILLGLLILSAVFILLISGKVGRISPIRALQSGRSEVYFDSRLNTPVLGKMLSPSLALRQFTSGKRRYITSIIIASILVFFLLTMTGMTDAVSSENAQRAMGATSENIAVTIPIDYSPENTKIVNEQLELTENVIREYTDILERYRMSQRYMLLEGVQLACEVAEDEECFTITKGRVPRYKNEIVVGEIYADEMGYDIGDEVKVSYQGNTGDFIITGFCTGLQDTGRFFGMTGDGARTLRKDFAIHWAGYKLKDTDKLEEIEKTLKDKLMEECRVNTYTPGEASSLFVQLSGAIKAVIYAISIISALVVVSMVCTKTFVREKTDIGIYKSMGFTTAGLRMQFAVRFLIVAVLGIVIGVVLSLSFSEKLLSLLLRSMGIANFVIDFRFITVFLPIVAVALSYFVFAYMVSGNIKKVEVRNLITE
ncbi:MAG: FtsX-like permease family protein [Lachnospiraceae bacterium]|nr:FtsX-like permease family protein [Lachnospiraceae bacterium]